MEVRTKSGDIRRDRHPRLGSLPHFRALPSKSENSHQFMADAQYTYARSMDTSSAPYSEQYYPYNPNLSYGRSDYNVTNSFKLFGMWQPVFFHGSNGWLEKVAGGWSLSGIWNWHSGFPYTANVSTSTPGNLYCINCGYNTLLPAAYLGGAGTSTSNKAFEQIAVPGSPNFPLGGAAYFSTPTYTTYNCMPDCAGTSLPQSPGVARNSIYRKNKNHFF